MMMHHQIKFGYKMFSNSKGIVKTKSRTQTSDSVQVIPKYLKTVQQQHPQHTDLQPASRTCRYISTEERPPNCRPVK